MRGFRLYRDCGTDEDTGKSLKSQFRAKDTTEGNVLAVFLDPYTGNPMWTARMTWTMGDVPYTCECMAAVFAHPNSAVACTGVSNEYLRKNCIRVSESVARKIHPEMFLRLDQQESEQ